MGGILGAHPAASAARAVVVSLATVGIVLGITWAVRDDVQPAVFVPFVAAVLISAWLGGTAGAVIATVLSIFAVDYFLIDPDNFSFHLSDRSQLLRVSFFGLTSALIIVVHELRRRSEEAHMRSEERLAIAMAAGQMGDWEWDIRTDAVRWSEELEAIHGLEPGKFEGTFQAFLEDVLPEDREHVQNVIGGSLRSGVHEVEYRIVRPDGQVRWVLGKGKLEPDRNGAPVRMVGVCTDVTERKEGEEALRRSQGYLRNALETAGLGLCDYDLERDQGWTSPELLEMYGLPADRQKYQIEDLYAITHPDDRERLRGAVTEMFESGGVIEVEYRTIRPDNKEARWFRAIGRRDPNVPSRRFIGVVEDITERKREEERQQVLAQAGSALVSSLDYEETLKQVARLIVPGLADGCIIDLVSSPGELQRVAMVHANPEKEALLRELSARYPPHKMEWHPLFEVMRTRKSMFIPEVSASTLQSIAQDATHLEMLREMETTAGIIVPLVAHDEALGTITLYAWAGSNRQFREADVRSAEELGRMSGLAISNARLYAEGQRTQEELREANRAKDDFLGMISHELRTPITTISSGSQILLEREELEKETVREVLSDLHHESERLQMIIENLLTLARAEMGQRPEIEPVALSPLVERVVRGHRQLRPGREILVRVGEVPFVIASPIYTELVLRNLLDNADKYSSRGQPVEVEAQLKGREVIVSVKDRGPGIPEEEREMIFERFYRSRETSGKASGAGMGLAVCRRLVEAQGGTIWSEAREGGGLEMNFRLPVYDESPVKARSNKSQELRDNK